MCFVDNLLPVFPCQNQKHIPKIYNNSRGKHIAIQHNFPSTSRCARPPSWNTNRLVTVMMDECDRAIVRSCSASLSIVRLHRLYPALANLPALFAPAHAYRTGAHLGDGSKARLGSRGRRSCCRGRRLQAAVKIASGVALAWNYCGGRSGRGGESSHKLAFLAGMRRGAVT